MPWHIDLELRNKRSCLAEVHLMWQGAFYWHGTDMTLMAWQVDWSIDVAVHVTNSKWLTRLDPDDVARARGFACGLYSSRTSLLARLRAGHALS